jgi:hypothetical protein
MLPISIRCGDGTVRVEAQPGGPVRLSVRGPRDLVALRGHRDGVTLSPEAVQLLLAALVVARRDAHGLPLGRS